MAERFLVTQRRQTINISEKKFLVIYKPGMNMLSPASPSMTESEDISEKANSVVNIIVEPPEYSPTVEAAEAEVPDAAPAPEPTRLASVDSIINILEADAVAHEVVPESKVATTGRKRARAQVFAPARVGSRHRKQPERLKY